MTHLDTLGKSNKRHEDCEKPDGPRAICKDSIEGKNACEPKCEKRCKDCDNNEKERQNCTGNRRKRSSSCRGKSSSRASDESCDKVDGKQRYSQQSIFSIPQDRKSCSILIPDIVLGTNTNVSKTTRRFYVTHKNEKSRRLSPSSEERKRKCGNKEKDEIKKRCVKGSTKCISRKNLNDKKSQISQSVQKDESKKSREITKQSHHTEFCAVRKKSFMKDEMFKVKKDEKEEPTEKDNKSEAQLIKEQIEREYKEIEECKKGKKKEKNNGTSNCSM